ncbi:hypothetical protein [Halomonas sp. A11-A]|jgi:hypothetical protein|uniref:hypothetical protein n=1 Tax=Halomonas sp. A11-A TaxID=2183985 RepID=UPI000D71032A|nr:hypothetical protein [Halomonas sp. A11-A]PWV71505.1 hypothetical protein DER72_12153 [Halomonas sp. A11-A]
MTVSFTRKRLYRVGSRPLELAVEDVKQLAEVVWYRGYRPTQAEMDRLRDVMSREEFQRALCVLELLSQYPVCRRDTARHLQQLTRHFHRQLLGGDGIPTQGRYSPSKRWGLNDATAPLRKALLPMQTRTYADATGHRHGLSA